MYKTHRRRQLKIGSKNRCSHNMQTVLIALRKKQGYRIVTCLKVLKYN